MWVLKNRKYTVYQIRSHGGGGIWPYLNNLNISLQLSPLCLSMKTVLLIPSMRYHCKGQDVLCFVDGTQKDMVKRRIILTLKVSLCYTVVIADSSARSTLTFVFTSPLVQHLENNSLQQPHPMWVN